MNISCTQKAGSRYLLTISIEDEPFKEIHIDIFGQKPHLPETVATIEELEQKINRLEYEGAKKYALKRLSIQAHLTEKLRKLMQERRVTPDTIEKVLTYCQEQGYLNDQEWVEAFIRGQIRKKVGPQMIKHKLREKGATEEQIRLSLRDLNQSTQIRSLLETRLKGRNKQKAIAALMRKGYSLDAILSEIGN